MIKTMNKQGYHKGRLDGYNRGREQGLAQAIADIEKQRLEEIQRKTVSNVLVIASSTIPSLEIGILQPFNYMSELGELEYRLKFSNEVTQEDVAEAAHIIFVRTVEPKMFDLLEWANEHNKNTIYYIDDNFMAIDPNTSIGQYYLTPKRLKTYLRFLKHARVIKVDSTYFANYIRDHFNENVVCFPGSVDCAFLDQIEKPNQDGSQIIIGYEGGNKENAFQQVVPALEHILDEYDGLVRLEFMGFTPSKLVDHPSVTSIPANPDYKEFIANLYQRNWDIGIAPLEDNHFNHCKTNNKFREYSACGIPGIYANSPPYAEWIEHSHSGYLVGHSQEEWHKALVTMIEDRSLREQMKVNAAAIAREHFAVKGCAESWKKELFLKGEV